MRRTARRRHALLLLGLLALLPATGGCRLANFLGDNFSLNIVLPLGLGGSGGVLTILNTVVDTLFPPPAVVGS